jgi:flagellar hook assembly protein FlgD
MDGTASLIQLSSLIRTPLRTPYLVRDYNGQTEDAYHLVNEPFTYPNEVRTDQITKPSFVLHQNYPNPFNPSTSVQFSIPAEGNVRIEICNVTGETVDVLADKQYSAGSHLVVWQAKNKANGVYFCRMLYNGSAKVKSMLLLK